MEYIDWQLNRFQESATQPALIWHDRTRHYVDLIGEYERWRAKLTAAGIQPGWSVAVVGDYSPESVACLLALLNLKCVLVPLAAQSHDQHAEFFRIAEVDAVVEIKDDGSSRFMRTAYRNDHPLLAQIRAAGEPGLLLFSSGSTGKPKAILHALPVLLEKFRIPRRCYRTINFLLFDHMGGLNTLFYTLANVGCIVVPADRSVTGVCRAIEQHQVELLPTSPSFLNLMLLAQAPRNFDLSSLKLITYGTEVMPERTLALANEAFPNVSFQQTYGLSELGVLRSKSASNSSLLVRVGGEDYETKVVDGTLRIRSKTSMLGYLNAPSPFDDDGWFDTGDMVIQDGDYYRILGRQTDLVNVGGQKVFPAEVEKVIAELPGVIDVAVSGEPHLLFGQIVVATVQTVFPVSALEMKRQIAEWSKGRLQPYMVPAKVRVVADSLVNYRYKKVRR